MEFEERYRDKRSSLRHSKERGIPHKNWRAEDQFSQNGRRIHESTMPPSIFGTKKKRLSKRTEAQKCYREATEHFIAAYQSYEKIAALLQEAKSIGDLAKIEYISHIYMKEASNLTSTMNLMDQAKKTIKHEYKRHSGT